MEKKNVNQTINLLKLIASFFVVFIHIHFPGFLGKFADCTARFAVPFFFIVSGYYSFNVPTQRIKLRVIRLLKILCYSTIVYGFLRLYECLWIYKKDISYFCSFYLNKVRLIRLFIFGLNPFEHHLWYLHAILFVYLLYSLYITLSKKLNKKSLTPVYMISILLFTIMFILSLINERDNQAVFVSQYRNAYLFGLPFFSLGLFLRDTNIKDKLKSISNYQLMFFLIFTNLLALVQYKYLGKTDLPLGSAFVAVFVFLLGIKNPILPSKTLGNLAIKYLDRLSLLIYLIHPIVRDCCERMFNVNLYFFPLVVIIVSFGLGTSYLYCRETVFKDIF